MHNLIRNAIQYNQANGWVKVRTHRCHEAVELTVENTGHMVDPARVSALFEPFERGTAARRTGSGSGSGLGLSIARSIAESHGGTITAAARSGGGLSVTVTLPVPVQPDKLPRTEQPDPGGRFHHAGRVP